MEPNAIALIAMGGFAVPVGMALKAFVDFSRIRHRNSDTDYLELIVNGKDYSVDLKTIGNGGSERIREALAELERCA